MTFQQLEPSPTGMTSSLWYILILKLLLKSSSSHAHVEARIRLPAAGGAYTSSVTIFHSKPQTNKNQQKNQPRNIYFPPKIALHPLCSYSTLQKEREGMIFSLRRERNAFGADGRRLRKMRKEKKRISRCFPSLCRVWAPTCPFHGEEVEATPSYPPGMSLR